MSEIEHPWVSELSTVWNFSYQYLSLLFACRTVLMEDLPCGISLISILFHEVLSLRICMLLKYTCTVYSLFRQYLISLNFLQYV